MIVGSKHNQMKLSSWSSTCSKQQTREDLPQLRRERAEVVQCLNGPYHGWLVYVIISGKSRASMEEIKRESGGAMREIRERVAQYSPKMGEGLG